MRAFSKRLAAPCSPEVRLKLEEGLLLGEDRLKLDDGLPLVGFIDVCMDVASEVAFVVNDAELESWLYCRVGTCWRPPSLNRLLNVSLKKSLNVVLNI